MDCKKIIILKVLELIKKDRVQSQRSISKRLNISLGNINSILKGLLESGFIELKEDSKNRVQYILTKKGNIEKIRLVYEYLNFSLAFYCDIKKRIMKTFNALCKKNIRSVVFYGAGELAGLAFELIQQTPLELRAVVDPNHVGKMFFSEQILCPSELSSLKFDKLFITELIGGRTIEFISRELTISTDDLVTLD